MKRSLSCLLIAAGLLFTPGLHAQTTRLTLDLSKPGVGVSPKLYGLMTEEINHSYDGGLYAELIRNRIFKDNPQTPEAWSLVQTGGGRGSIQLIAPDPLNVPREQRRNAINDALTTCLQLVVAPGGASGGMGNGMGGGNGGGNGGGTSNSNSNGGGGRVGIANAGYWGIPVKPQTEYRASFYAKATDSSAMSLNVSIESNDGATVYASAPVTLTRGGWKKYELRLNTAAGISPTIQAHFVISTGGPGTYFFNLVSLFPPTYNNRPNGNRIDIMQLMADMKPAFLRFPGGNFLEGDYFATRFPWKTTLGPLEERPGHPGCWQYRASDGLGLLEFLEWCEDLHIEPLLAVYAGYALRGDHVEPGPLLQPYIDEALEEIEYVTGDVSTKWGARRAADGHPKPFVLTDIEIGNEDWFDRSLTYDGRFSQFRAAIQAKYPQLRCISTIADKQNGKVSTRTPEMIDEHYYRSAWQMEEDADHYDSYDRAVSPKIFVGEWATREGAPTTNMNAALGDAAWMTGMERNSDIVERSCYAPLFVNVNPKKDSMARAWQWDSDLIGYNAMNSFGSPSYYAQKMFNNYLGNTVVPVAGEGIPVRTATAADSTNKRALPRKTTIPTLFYVATRDTRTGDLFLKVVNSSGKAQKVAIALDGAGKIAAGGTLIVLKSGRPEDTNTIDDPEKIVPLVSAIKGIGKAFSRVFDPYSISVIKLHVE
jgi:alpha-N-arabinofuranosidase